MNRNLDYLVREKWGEGKTTIPKLVLSSLTPGNSFLLEDRTCWSNDFSAKKNRETVHSVADLRRLSEDKTKSTKITLFVVSYG